MYTVNTDINTNTIFDKPDNDSKRILSNMIGTYLSKFDEDTLEIERKISIFSPYYNFGIKNKDGLEYYNKNENKLNIFIEEENIHTFKEQYFIKYKEYKTYDNTFISDMVFLKYILLHEYSHSFLGHISGISPPKKCTECFVEAVLCDLHVEHFIKGLFKFLTNYHDLANCRIKMLQSVLKNITNQTFDVTKFEDIQLYMIEPDCSKCKICNKSKDKFLIYTWIKNIEKLREQLTDDMKASLDNIISDIETNGCMHSTSGTLTKINISPMTFNELICTMFESKTNNKKLTNLPNKRFIATMMSKSTKPVYGLKYNIYKDNVPDTILIDTSGSMGLDNIIEILSKISGLLTAYNLDEDDIKVYTFSNELLEHNIDDIISNKINIEVAGTNLGDAVDELKNKDIEFENILVITDLEVFGEDFKKLITLEPYILSTNAKMANMYISKYHKIGVYK